MAGLITQRILDPDPAVPSRVPSSANAARVPVIDADAIVSRLRRDPSLSCILPCRNEAENLEQLLPRLAATLGVLVADWEVIIVDDGSTDATSGALARWAREPGIRVLQLSRNFGKEAALTAGLQCAGRRGRRDDGRRPAARAGADRRRFFGQWRERRRRRLRRARGPRRRRPVQAGSVRAASTGSSTQRIASRFPPARATSA